MRGAIISYLGTKIVIICILFLHTMLTILYLLEWNSANQKFKNYANPTNLANFWMPKMLLFHSHGRHYAPSRSLSFLFRSFSGIKYITQVSATCCLLGNILLSRIRELENVSQYAE